MSAEPAIIITPKKPLAHRSGGERKYQSFLKGEARHSISIPLAGRLYSKAYYFHRGKSDIDADNLSKPILDAFKGIIYHDDAQVVLRVVSKINLETDTYELIQDGIPPDRYQRLIELISSEQHVLYLEVGELTSFRLNLGSHSKEELQW
jgi:hypothetical protein